MVSKATNPLNFHVSNSLRRSPIAEAGAISPDKRFLDEVLDKGARIADPCPLSVDGGGT